MEKWKQILSEWPELAIDDETGLMFAPEFPYNESHRHFSHPMSFHPLGLLDYSKGDADRTIINNTLRNLEEQGTDYWTGYSFSWLGNLYARAFEGEKAVKALTTFAECFCLRNTFHANGDQCKAGHSKFTYRPFTLEGNFAFASAIQEMLIQSHTGVVRLFPAIPENWEDAAFENLRTYGAFLLSADMKNGNVEQVIIHSEKGGEVLLENPFGEKSIKADVDCSLENNIIRIKMEEGESVHLQAIL